MAKTASTSFSLSNYSQKLPFFAVLMYSLYCHPRYFKFKRKYQQYDPCFPTIFPFLMIMYLYIYFFQSIIQDKTRSSEVDFFQIKSEQIAWWKLSEAAIGGILWNRCSLNFRKIRKKTSVSQSFLKKRLRHKCVPANCEIFKNI